MMEAGGVQPRQASRGPRSAGVVGTKWMPSWSAPGTVAARSSTGPRRSRRMVASIRRRDVVGGDAGAGVARVATVVAVARHEPPGLAGRWVARVDDDHLGRLTDPRQPILHRPGHLVSREAW
jgi:hypothetical protein